MPKFSLVKSLFKKPAPKCGDINLFHYVRESTAGKKRIHLRIDPDESGVLVINASQIYYLNPTATIIAFLTLENEPEQKIVQKLCSKYAISKVEAAQDIKQFKGNVEKIISPDEEICPICDIESEILVPFGRHPSAPYRMDLALTYRCNNNCLHCYNEVGRANKELIKDDWFKVLEKIWELGIPHVVFTGGEPTLIEFLPELISHAEHLGLITGINTNGRKLSDSAYVSSLVDAGLDHIQITLESHLPEVHNRIVANPSAWEQTIKGINNSLQTKLFVMTNTTLLRSNSPYLSETLDFLYEIGVPTIGLNGLIHSGRGSAYAEEINETELQPLLNIAKSHIEKTNQRLIWYTPTMYCRFNPIESGFGVKGCSAALNNMCIEPNGDVLPCQSFYQSLGNFLTNEWDSIWQHELSIKLRNRGFTPEECKFCDVHDSCGGGCPLYSTNEQSVTVHPINSLPF